MVHEAAVALGGETTNTAVRDWILDRYPGSNQNTINAQIVACTVNNPSRVNFPQNKKPRAANSSQDFLFRTGKGRLVLYQPDKHGLWAIEVDDTGKPRIVEVSESPSSAEQEPAAEGASAFAAELTYETTWCCIWRPSNTVWSCTQMRTGMMGSK
jgi:hypothetical protein